MKFAQSLLLSIGLSSSLAHAIVIRHDVPDTRYSASPADFPPLATLYNIGVHGTLIHPQWVVTAAHAVFCMNTGQKINVGGKVVAVANRFSHPDYQLGDKHDIALIQLNTPITTINPAKLYSKTDEQGAEVWFIGVGGTGTGLTGQTIGYKENNGKLRKAQNKIVATTKSDIVFKFEKGSAGLALEGVSGNGDSGGPAFVKNGDQYELLGVSSRADSWFYDIGEYGVTELYTRVSSYKVWIEQVISAQNNEAREKLASTDPFLHEGMKSEKMHELCSSIEVK